MTQTAVRRKSDILDTLVIKIHQGVFDSHLQLLSNAIYSRKRAIREESAIRNMAELSAIGTRVRIISRIKPRYLAGLTGEVVNHLSAYITKGYLTNLVTARLAETSQRGRVMYYRRTIYTD